MNQAAALQLRALAAANWDPFDLEAPQTHRTGLLGRAAIAGKWALRVLHRQAFEPQRAINQQLLELITRAIRGADGPSLDCSRDDRGLAADVKAALAALKDPRRFPVFEGAISKQHEWNLAAWRLLDATVTGGPLSLERVHFMRGQLTRSGVTSRSELFARQAVFNKAIEATLGHFHGVPRPADRGDGYPFLAHEAARTQEIAPKLRKLAQRPLISVVTPTFETPAALLRSCIDSVRAQSYDNWELCLADDGSKSAEVRAVIAEYSDPRIRHTFLPVNAGIASATNAALQMARGQFVGFLDHDDTLAPDALAEIAIALEEDPDIDLFYSDEDRLDLQGHRTLPFFKPGWSPDMLRSGNYVCHFLVVRRERVGRVREGFEGAQDFDLVLRLSEANPKVRHIPEVLYHWRETPLSTAVHVANKPEAGSAGARALAGHLARCNVSAQVVSPAPTQYQVRYSAIGAPRVALVCAPKDSMTRWARRFGANTITVGTTRVDGAQWVRWDGPRDLGAMYGRAMLEHAADVYVFMDEHLEPVHPETSRGKGEPRPQRARSSLDFSRDERGLFSRGLELNGLSDLVALATQPEIGVVGAKLLYADGTIRHAGLWASPDGSFIRPFQHQADDGEWTTIGNSNFTRNFVAISGACFAVRAEVIADAMPRGNNPELGLCARAREAGLRVVCSPLARFTHLGLEADPPLRHTLGPDPYLNPNVDRRR